MARRREELELAAVDRASQVVDRVAGKVGDLEKADPTVQLDADDRASGDIDKVSDAARDLDGTQADVDISATGLDDLLDKLGEVPGSLGDIASKLKALPLTGPAGIAGAAGILAGALFAAANNAADTAIAVDDLARLTGDSHENASRLQTVWKNTGADTKDLQDVLLQMNGVLADNPELARQLGARMGEGIPISETFVSVIEGLNSKIGDTAERSRIASKVFGEEGVRQVNTLVGVVDGDLRRALEDVPEANIIDEEEVDKARDMKAAMAELTVELQGIALELSQNLIPLFSTLLGLVEKLKIGETFELGLKPLDQFNFGLGQFKKSLDAIVTTDLIGTVSSDMRSVAEQADAAAAKTVELDTATRSNTVAARRLVEQLEAEREAASNLTDTLDANVDAIYEQRDAHRQARDAARRVTEVMEDEKSTADDVEGALDDLAQAAGRAAKADVEIVRQKRAARGASLSHTEQLDIENRSLLDQAARLDGPQRRAIVAHIARINGISEKRATRITAELNPDNIARVGERLGNVSRNRDLTIRADAITGEAEAQINYAARDRHGNIIVTPIIQNPTGSNIVLRQRAGFVPPGETAVVGEAGAEDVDTPTLVRGPVIVRRRPNLRRDTGPAQIINQTFHMPPGVDPIAYADSARRYRARNGVDP